MRNACAVHAGSPGAAWLAQERRLPRSSVPQSRRWRMQSRCRRFVSTWRRTGRAGHARCLRGQSPRGQSACGWGPSACKGFRFAARTVRSAFAVHAASPRIAWRGGRGARGGVAFCIRGDGACSRGAGVLCRRGGVPARRTCTMPSGAAATRAKCRRLGSRCSQRGSLCSRSHAERLRRTCGVTTYCMNGRARRLQWRSVPHSWRWRVKSRCRRFVPAWRRTGRTGHARCLQGRSPCERNAGSWGLGTCKGFRFAVRPMRGACTVHAA